MCLQADLGETRERVQKYEARLKEVQARRTAFASALAEGDSGCEGAAGERFDDTASEGGSSAVSGLSMYTQAMLSLL